MRIRWFKDALFDLKELRKYIENDNFRAARDVARNILIHVEQLAEHPSMGRPGRVEGTRELVISGLPYIIPYRVRNNIIEILRVLHAARKWPTKF